jgi:hypothetical protein
MAGEAASHQGLAPGRRRSSATDAIRQAQSPITLAVKWATWPPGRKEGAQSATPRRTGYSILSSTYGRGRPPFRYRSPVMASRSE